MANKPASALKAMIAYDACPCSPDDLTEKDIENYYKSFNQNTNYGQGNKIKSDKEKKDLKNKLGHFKSMLNSIEHSVNMNLSGLGFKINQVKLDSSISLEGNDCFTKLTYFQKKDGTGTRGNVNMNLNIKNLLKYPAAELRLLVTASILESVMSKSDLEGGNNIQDVYNKDDRVMRNYNAKIQELNKQKDFKRAHKLFSDYAEGFIKDYNKGMMNKVEGVENLNVTRNVVEMVSMMFLEGMNDSEIRQVVRHNFAPLNRVKGAVVKELTTFDEEHKTNYETIREQRLEKINEDAMAAKTDSVRFMHQNQYKALADLKLADKFKKAKGDLSNPEKSEIKDFVSNYAQNIVNGVNAERQAKGLPAIDPVKIKFVNNPASKAMGEFHERSDSQWIEINLAKVGNIVDLATTLSHEITHYTDSASNKKDGKKAQNSTTGLLNDISENISGSGFPKGSPAHNLLKDVNKYCYVVNPNERRARLSELASYTFMLKFASDDPRMKQQITDSLQGRMNSKTKKLEGGFIQYQQKTIDHMKNLDKNIEKFTQELVSMRIPEDSKGYRMIKERIDYLKQVKQIYQREQTLPEYQAIKQAQEELGQNNGSYVQTSANDKYNEIRSEVTGNSKDSTNNQVKKNQKEQENLKRIKEMQEKQKEQELDDFVNQQQMGR
ncbi:MAG: hypothetical protein IJX17_03590 [Clostridia bacterium]|nr:hypothetical protein [Clostridia bacterium]